MAGKITKFFGKLPSGGTPGGGSQPAEKRKHEVVIVIDSPGRGGQDEQVAKRARSGAEPARSAAESSSSKQQHGAAAAEAPTSAHRTAAASPSASGHHAGTPLASSQQAASQQAASQQAGQTQSQTAPADVAATAALATNVTPAGQTSTRPHAEPVDAHAAACTPAAAGTPAAPTPTQDHAAAAQAALKGNRDQLLQDLSLQLKQVNEVLGREHLLPCSLNKPGANRLPSAVTSAAAQHDPSADEAALAAAAAPTSSQGTGALLPNDMAEVAAFLEGQVKPLSLLLPQLAAATGLGETRVQDLVRDLAVRRNYAAAAEGATIQGWQVTADDTTAGSLWVWELVDMKKGLGALKMPALKRQAEAQRRRRKELHSLSVALNDAVELLQKRATNKGAETKLLKAMQKVLKLPNLQQIEAQCQESMAAGKGKPAAGTKPAAEAAAVQQAPEDGQAVVHLISQAAGKGPREGAKEQKDPAVKEADKAAKEAERAAKEAEKAAREAQKEVEKAAKEAQREAERAAKELEKEAKKDARKAAKTGFGDKKALTTAAGIMQMLFVKAAPKGQGGSPEAAGPSTGGGSQRAQRPTCSGGSAAADPSRIEQLRCELDASLARRLSNEELQQCILRLKGKAGAGQGRLLHKTSVRRRLGPPPTWARKPNCSLDPAEHVNRHYGEGADWSRVKAWRRKLLMFAHTNRPAYYGSFSHKSKVVRPRNPLSQDKSLLDYDNDSDEDWEEEPEGEDLGDDAMEEDEPEAAAEPEEEQADGFMVEDGYLSDDEGVHDSQMGGAAEAEEGAQGRGEHAQSRPKSHADPRLQQLQGAIDRAAKSNRSLLLSRDPCITCDQSSGLDLQVLDALQPIFFRSAPPAKPVNQDYGLYAHLQPQRALPAEALVAVVAAAGAKLDCAAAAGAGKDCGVGAATAGVKGTRGRPSAPFPDALVPALLAFLTSNGALKVDQLVDGFIASVPGQTLSKKAVKHTIKERAAYDHKAGAWRLRQGGTPESSRAASPAPPPVGGATAAAAAAASSPLAAWAPSAGVLPAGLAAGTATLAAATVTMTSSPEPMAVDGVGASQGHGQGCSPAAAMSTAPIPSPPAATSSVPGAASVLHLAPPSSQASGAKPKGGLGIDRYFVRPAAKTPQQQQQGTAGSGVNPGSAQQAQGAAVGTSPAAQSHAGFGPGAAAALTVTAPQAQGASGGGATPSTPPGAGGGPALVLSLEPGTCRPQPPANTPEAGCGPRPGSISQGTTPVLAAVAARAADVGAAAAAAEPRACEDSPVQQGAFGSPCPTDDREKPFGERAGVCVSEGRQVNTALAFGSPCLPRDERPSKRAALGLGVQDS